MGSVSKESPVEPQGTYLTSTPADAQEACQDAGPNAAVRDQSSDEEISELSTSQMHDMIDLVVVKLSGTPMWRKIPPNSAERVISELKANYDDSKSAKYSRAQAVALMELTGRRL